MIASLSSPPPVTLHIYRLREGVRLLAAGIPYDAYRDDLLYWDGEAAAHALFTACTDALLVLHDFCAIDLATLEEVNVIRNSADGSPLFAIPLPNNEIVYVSQTPIASLDRWGKELDELRDYRLVKLPWQEER